MKNDMRVLNNVKSIRVDKGLSVSKLAKRANLSNSTISDVENGIKKPGQLVMMRISKALKEPTHEVFDLNWRNKPYL